MFMYMYASANGMNRVLNKISYDVLSFLPFLVDLAVCNVSSLSFLLSDFLNGPTNPVRFYVFEISRAFQ